MSLLNSLLAYALGVDSQALNKTSDLMTHFATEGRVDDFQYFICGAHIGYGVAISKYVGKDEDGEVIIPKKIHHGKAAKMLGKFGEGLDVYPVIMIGDQAFYNRNDVTSVYIPSSVKEIGIMAFYGCTNLTKIEIPEEVNEIRLATFANCEKLKSIILPNYIYEIGVDAFKNCSSLSSLTFPKYLSTIRCGAFRNCTSLKSVDLPKSVYVEEGAFDNFCIIRYL